MGQVCDLQLLVHGRWRPLPEQSLTNVSWLQLQLFLEKEDMGSYSFHITTNFCNVLYAKMPLKFTWKLQFIQNKMVLVTKVILQILYKVCTGYQEVSGLQFKVLILSYKALHGFVLWSELNVVCPMVPVIEVTTSYMSTSGGGFVVCLFNLVSCKFCTYFLLYILLMYQLNIYPLQYMYGSFFDVLGCPSTVVQLVQKRSVMFSHDDYNL